MPRIARKSLRSSFFHVIVQGYEKRPIFDKEYFKSEYLKLMLQELPKFGVELLAYCIMDNHAHILLFCERIEEMSKYMKNVNTKYAIYYNKKKNRVGYVFRSRFMSETVKSRNHLYSCISYIHFNPVVAGMIRLPEEYQFSSYNDYIYKNGIVTDNVLHRVFESSNNYLDLFHFIHLEAGKGFELKLDTPRVSHQKAKEIISRILNEVSFSDVCMKEEKYEVQKYFFKRFIREGVTIYHIERILKIDHRKVKRIIRNNN